MTLLAAVFQRLAVLLAADTVTLGTADHVEVRLIGEPFTPTPTTDYSLLDAPANNALNGGLISGGPPLNVALDPATGNSVISLVDPVSGWRWVSLAAGPDTYPVVVYGFAIQNVDSGDAFGGQLMPNGPVTITADGQLIDLGSVSITINPAGVS